MYQLIADAFENSGYPCWDVLQKSRARFDSYKSNKLR